MLPSRPAGEPEFAAFVAIDWADREHVWVLQVAGASQRESGKLEHTPEAIEVWAAGLATRFGGRPVAVGLEQTRGALVYALSKYSHLVLYPIHSTTSARYRRAMFPSGCKGDPQDADLLLDLLLKHRDRLRALRPDSEPIRKLRALVEQRRQLVDQTTAHTNRIIDLLKLYFPQLLQWVDKVQSPLLQAMFERWPTLEQLQAAAPAELRRFFSQHNCRSRERIEQRLEQIRQARAIISDRAVIDPAVQTIQVLLGVVAVLRQGIAKLDRVIDEVACSHPDYALFASFPGAGPVLTPRLMAAFGSQRDRFASAGQVQSYSGIAPVIERSGDTQFWTHFRWACPKFLRQSFQEFAALSIPHCGWAREFYQRQRSRHKGHHAAVRALAFKWIRILFRCWQSGTPYQEDFYLNAVQRRQAARRSAPSPGPVDRPPAGDGIAPGSVPDPDRGRPPGVTNLADGRAHFLCQLGIALGCGSTVDFQFNQVAGFWKFSHAGS